MFYSVLCPSDSITILKGTHRELFENYFLHVLSVALYEHTGASV